MAACARALRSVTDCNGLLAIVDEYCLFEYCDDYVGVADDLAYDDEADLSAYERGDRSEGAIRSHYDRHGVYTADGQHIGSTCGCIDYPCCGH